MLSRVKTFASITVGILAAIAFVLVLAAESNAASRSVQVSCGQSLASAVNSDPVGTATRFVLSDCVYNVSSTLKPEDGDEIAGPATHFLQRGVGFDPEPVATIQGSATLAQVMKPQGTFRGEWFNCEGGNFTGSAGTGVCIAGGQMADDSMLYAVTVRDNEGAGVSNFHGTFWRGELTNNTTEPNALGFIGSGLKAVDEVWVVESYVHDTQGSGIWCDEFCNDTNASPNGTFYVNRNLIVNNGRAGVRFEKVGGSTSGEALIEYNSIHGNGWEAVKGGVSVRDASNAVVRGNSFGRVTIAGVTYPQNIKGLAAIVSDSGRSDRPNTTDVSVFDNNLNGETLKCASISSVVCRPNN